MSHGDRLTMYGVDPLDRNDWEAACTSVTLFLGKTKAKIVPVQSAKSFKFKLRDQFGVRRFYRFEVWRTSHENIHTRLRDRKVQGMPPNPPDIGRGPVV